MNSNEDNVGCLIFIIIGIVCIFFIGLIMWGLPQYNVWSSRLNGEAELAHAEYSRKVQVADAEGQLAAAKALAEAATTINESLSDEYLRYLWIKAMEKNGGNETFIYLPSGDYIPNTEASRLGKQAIAK